MVRRYGLEAETTRRTVNDQTRSLEIRVSAGAHPAAIARQTQSMKLPTVAKEQSSVRQGAGLDRPPLNQNGGNPSSQGILHNPEGSGYRDGSDYQHMEHHVQNPTHGPFETGTESVATGGGFVNRGTGQGYGNVPVRPHSIPLIGSPDDSFTPQFRVPPMMDVSLVKYFSKNTEEYRMKWKKAVEQNE